MNRVLASAVVALAAGVAQAAVVTGPIVELHESNYFTWGAPSPITAFWSIRNLNSGYIYGGFPGVNAQVYVAGQIDPLTVSDASAFPYTASTPVFMTGDTIFFRNNAGYYGAWVVDITVIDIFIPIAYLDGTWYYQDDGSANFSGVTPTCRPDLTAQAAPGTPGYGTPDGNLNSEDFFYYLAQYAAGNLAVADLTASAAPGSPGYGVPNGVLNSEDFFFYLALYAAGC